MNINRLNDLGEVVQITHNPQSMDSYLSIPVDKVKPLYQAIKTFDELLYANNNVFNIKMKSGEEDRLAYSIVHFIQV